MQPFNNCIVVVENTRVMKKMILVSFIANILIITTLNSQIKLDSLSLDHKKGAMKVQEFVVPGSLIVVGSLLSGSHLEKEIKNSFHDGSENSIDFSLPIDDLMQYVPAVEIYAADLIGVDAKNHWFDQTKYLILANLVTAGLTHAGKGIIDKQRPDCSDHAFPSGHTSFSFTNASVLFEEYKDTAPGLAYSGYALTSLVGGLRVVNNKHWLSDVLVGAGLGILVTKLIYHFEPLKNWNPFQKNDRIILAPNLKRNHVGLYFKMEF